MDELCEKLIVDEEFSSPGVEEISMVCNVKIYGALDKSKYEVIISVPSNPDYLGRTETNGFEFLATAIKNKYLKKVKIKSIEWFDCIQWREYYKEDLLVKVVLKRKWFKYCDPMWTGAIG